MENQEQVAKTKPRSRAHHVGPRPAARGDRMLTISEDSGLFTTMIFVEVSPDNQKEVFEATISATEEKIRHLPGFTAAASHNSLDGKMVAEYEQWESEEHFGEASLTPQFGEHVTEIARLVEDAEFGPYEVRRVDVGEDVTEATMVVSEGREPVTEITRYKVRPEDRRALLDLLLAGKPEHPLSGLSGFVGAALLEGLGGDRVVEYLRFASEEQLKAAKRSPRAKSYEAAVRRLARANAHLYGVDYAAPSARRG